MSLEAGNWRKSLVTLAVTAGYFFSLKITTDSLPTLIIIKKRDWYAG
jgi:hypothetical protein